MKLIKLNLKIKIKVVREIQDVDFSELFLVSYDVTSLFTNIPLTETIDLAVTAIFESNAGSDLKRNKIQLKKRTF